MCLTSAGGLDGFVCKLDSGGNFVWARRLGGMDQDRIFGVAVDASGDSVHQSGPAYWRERIGEIPVVVE